MPEAKNIAPGRLQVEPVEGAAGLRRLIRMPGVVSQGDPAWMPPLHLQRRLHLGPRNRYFQHADWQAWLALRDGRPAGRISARVDHMHRERDGNDTSHLGLPADSIHTHTTHPRPTRALISRYAAHIRLRPLERGRPQPESGA